MMGDMCSSKTLVPSITLQGVMLAGCDFNIPSHQIFQMSYTPYTYAKSNDSDTDSEVPATHHSLRVSCLCDVKLLRAMCNVHSS